MKNIRSLFTNTLTVTKYDDGACGNVIEVFMGAKISDSRKADLGFWELKSKNLLSNSKVTLNSIGKNGSLDALINNAIAKMKNTLFVWYCRNGNEINIVRIDVCYGFNEEFFRSQIGKMVKLETRSNGEKSLRIAKGYFKHLFRQVTTVER